MYLRLNWTYSRVYSLFCILLFLGISNSNWAQNSKQQNQAEYNVEYYLRDKFKDKGFYQSLSFGQVETIIPREIQYLNDLEAQKKEAIQLKDYYGKRYDSILRVYDSLILFQKETIKQNKIRNFYSINHVFSLKQDKSYTLFEGKFFLSANLLVKDLELALNMPLTEDDYDWFYFFTQKYNLFSGGNEYKNQELSEDIYYFFSSYFSQAGINKAAAIRSMLIAISTIRKANSYDPQKITQAVVRYHLSDPISGYTKYEALKFSQTKQLTSVIQGKDSLIGYNVFHRFYYRTESQNDTSLCLYFEFNPWFVISGTFIVNPPYDKYFENE